MIPCTACKLAISCSELQMHIQDMLKTVTCDLTQKKKKNIQPAKLPPHMYSSVQKGSSILKKRKKREKENEKKKPESIPVIPIKSRDYLYTLEHRSTPYSPSFKAHSHLIRHVARQQAGHRFLPLCDGGADRFRTEFPRHSTAYKRVSQSRPQGPLT